MADTPKKTRKTPAPKAAAKPKARQEKGVSTRSVAMGTLSFGAVAGVLAAGVFGLLKLGKAHRGDGSFGSGEHKPTDLMGDSHPGATDRAVDAFRPDPTAPVPAGERDAFRPALAGASAPTLVKGQADGNQRLDAAPS